MTTLEDLQPQPDQPSREYPDGSVRDIPAQVRYDLLTAAAREARIPETGDLTVEQLVALRQAVEAEGARYAERAVYQNGPWTDRAGEQRRWLPRWPARARVMLLARIARALAGAARGDD